MRYWPLSVIRTSPLLPGDCAAELDSIYRAMAITERTFQACGFVVQRTEALTAAGLVVMEGDATTTLKLAYMSRPTQEQWERLERACIVPGPDSPNHFIFLVDPLH